MNEHLNPELERLQQGINILNALRDLFTSIPSDEERQRTWRYLADCFPEFEKAKMPLWHKEKSAPEPSTPVQQPSNLSHP